MKQKSECPVCHGFNSKYLFSVKKGQLISCQTCDLVYYTPRPSVQELELFYASEDYRSEFAQSLMSGEAFARQRYSQFEQSLNKYQSNFLRHSSRRLLDIGCGTGDFLRVAKENGWHISGIEISAQATRTANQMLEGEYVQSGDLFTLNLTEESYDVITIYHVIEHLIDPVEMLQEIFRLLQPKGIVFIETPNIGGVGAKFKKEHWSQIKPPEHISYFQPSSLKYALNKAGFSNNHIFTCSPVIIESITNMPIIKQQLTALMYKVAPLLNLGATLQGIGIKL